MVLEIKLCGVVNFPLAQPSVLPDCLTVLLAALNIDRSIDVRLMRVRPSVDHTSTLHTKAYQQMSMLSIPNDTTAHCDVH